ncbi:TetR family transcriptional regulator [Streptomyces rishiriensis]|uniref:TetR family transcriptional regulator n=1 Tax=Streptomyces rishiriensis TaxID=68264 RepID=UPI001FEAECD3|nr:TetR family transcriptional regulator [Streptomyces rishiriensis]
MAHVSTRTLYQHFPSKDAIVAARPRSCGGGSGADLADASAPSRTGRMILRAASQTSTS